MLGVGRDTHVIDEEVDAFLRVDKGKVGILVDHRDGIACVVRGHGGFAALHLVKDFVHDVSLHNVLLLFQLFGDGGNLVHRLRVHRQAGYLGGDGISIAGIVEHQHIVGVLHIPHVGPFRGRFFDHRRVVDKTRGAPHVRHAVLVAGVKAAVEIGFAHAGNVGDAIHIQLGQHALVDHLTYHVVRREDDIVGHAAGFQLGVQALVGIVGGVVDLDAGEILKSRNDIHAVIGAIGDV